jgi:hypothetical protein
LVFDEIGQVSANVKDQRSKYKDRLSENATRDFTLLPKLPGGEPAGPAVLSALRHSVNARRATTLDAG